MIHTFIPKVKLSDVLFDNHYLNINYVFISFLVSLNIIERCYIAKQWQASEIGTASEKRTKCPFPKCPLFGGSTVYSYLESQPVHRGV